MDETPAPPRKTDERWFLPGVRAGAASLLSDLGHEVPTALLPSFLTSTLGAPPALSVIEGIADGAGGIARFAEAPWQTIPSGDA